MRYSKKKCPMFGNRIEPNCSYCTYGRGGEGRPECTLHLFIDVDGTCTRFLYDPLKRTPREELDLRAFEFKIEDFKL